jgi:hemerythrin superfamily protein
MAPSDADRDESIDARQRWRFRMAGKSRRLNQNGPEARESATALLMADHARVRELVQQFQEAGASSSEKRVIAHQVFAELEIHAAIEEKLFYPAVAAASGEASALVAEAIEEHRKVKNQVAELKTLALGDREFHERFTAIVEEVDHHATEEEDEMFPKAEELIGADLGHLSARMQAMQAELRATKSSLTAA